MEQWAQLYRDRGRHPPLQRGYWYPVVDAGRKAGLRPALIRLAGITVPITDVRVVTLEPTAITRVAAFHAMKVKSFTGRIGTDAAHGICPKGHRLERLGSANRAKCSECNNHEYEVEDEVDQPSTSP